MASISPAERLRRELESTLDGVGEEVDPVEAVGRVGARLILQQALEDEVTEYLGLPSTSLGCVPLAKEYTRFREEEFARAAKEGRPRKPLPSGSKIAKRYGSWDAALVSAGLEPFRAPRLDRATGRAVTKGPRNWISDEDLSASPREAYEELGPPFTVNAYVAWQRSKSGIGKSGRRLPSYACVYGRYRGAPEGAWRAACDKALPNGWQGVR